jgi:hypothetical protein
VSDSRHERLEGSETLCALAQNVQCFSRSGVDILRASAMIDVTTISKFIYFIHS